MVGLRDNVIYLHMVITVHASMCLIYGNWLLDEYRNGIMNTQTWLLSLNNTWIVFIPDSPIYGAMHWLLMYYI